MTKYCLLILALLLLLGFNGIATAQIETTALTHDGIERAYQVYLPERQANRVLIALHDFASSGRAMETVTGLNAVADEYGFIVVYPDAAGYYWDDGRSVYHLPPQAGSVDDLGYLTALRDTLLTEYDIDPGQVYLTGIGSGGRMAYTAACFQPEQYAGIVVVSTLLWGYQTEYCPEAVNAAVNLLILHGNRDEFYTPDTHVVDSLDGTQRVLGAVDTLAFFGERNGCDTDVPIRIPDTTMLTYENCVTTTAFVAVQGSGGQWPRVGNYHLNQYGFDASRVIGAFVSGTDWQPLAVQSEIVDELPRTFRLFVPHSYDATRPTPLVVGLHGRTANANHQAWTSDFNAIAEREGFITLYPEGIDTQWNYLRGVPEGAEGTGPWDDNLFLDQLIADLSQHLNIDMNRIYVTGLSNGGFMTQRLACMEQDRYAAFASVAATGSFELPTLCEGQGPVPILYIHGTADTIVPMEGIEGRTADGTTYYISAPMTRTLSFWAVHNGCDTGELDIQTLAQVDSETTTRILTAQDCPEYAPLQFYMVIGGGHVWPGVRESNQLGISTRAFNASEVIWNFFKERSLDERKQ